MAPSTMTNKHFIREMLCAMMIWLAVISVCYFTGQNTQRIAREMGKDCSAIFTCGLNLNRKVNIEGETKMANNQMEIAKEIAKQNEMQTQIAIDSLTPESFAKSILPWISEKTGLKYDPKKMEFPNIITVPEPFKTENGKSLAAGLYDSFYNEITISVGQSQVGSEATLAHELTHYLQNMNGLMRKKTVKEIEKQAYELQRRFYNEIKKIDPNDVGLTEDFVNYAISQ